MKRFCGIFVCLLLAFGPSSSCSLWQDDDRVTSVFQLESFKEQCSSGNWKVGELTNAQNSLAPYTFQFHESGALIVQGPNVGSGNWHAYNDEDENGFLQINISTIGELQALNGDYRVVSFSNNALDLIRNAGGFQNLVFVRP